MKIDIRFGMCSPPLEDQVGHLIQDKDALGHMQKDADAISRLYVRGLIAKSVSDRAYDRLFKSIAAAAKGAGHE